MLNKIAYFGHPGSYSHKAAIKYIDGRLSDALMIPCETFNEVGDYVNQGFCGVLPLSNSTIGKIKAVNKLLNDSDFITIEVLTIPIHHYLMTKVKLPLSSVDKIVSHEQAILQCKNYIKKQCPRAKIVHYSSTASAARDVADGKFTDNTAVIGSSDAARLYGLKIIAKKIEDETDNATTFAIIEKSGSLA